MKRISFSWLIFSCLALVSGICRNQIQAVTIIVKADGSGDYPTIQQAIDNASPGDEGVLETGSYTEWDARGLQTRGKAITLRSLNPNDPDVAATTILDCQGNETTPRRAFWIHEGETGGTVIAGLTVINGYGYPEGGESTSSGGVMYLRNGPVLFSQCTFDSNYAARGGVVFSEFSGTGEFDDCTFTDNNAINGGVMNSPGAGISFRRCRMQGNTASENGGVIYCHFAGGMVTLENCLVKENSSGINGGAVYIENALITLTRNEFRENLTSEYGGAVFAASLGTSTDCVIKNNLFEKNGCDTLMYPYGAGLYIHTGSDNVVDIINNTFVQNAPGGLACRGTLQARNITNNIVCNNTGGGIYCETAPLYLDYNCVHENFEIIVIPEGEGDDEEPPLRNYTGAATPGPHDLDMDPLFVDAENGDYHILSKGGYWDPLHQGWRDDLVTENSPCLDAGDPATDASGETPYNGSRINIGAYGGTAQASKTYLQGDTNSDGKVDMLDFTAIAANWLVGTNP